METGDEWYLTGEGFLFSVNDGSGADGFVRGETYAMLTGRHPDHFGKGETNGVIDPKAFEVTVKQYPGNDIGKLPTDNDIDRTTLPETNDADGRKTRTKGQIEIVAAPEFRNYEVNVDGIGILEVVPAKIELWAEDLAKPYGDSIDIHLDNDPEKGLNPELVRGPGEYADNPFGLYNNIRLPVVGHDVAGGEGLEGEALQGLLRKFRIQQHLTAVDGGGKLGAEAGVGEGSLRIVEDIDDVDILRLVSDSGKYELELHTGTVDVEPRTYYLTVDPSGAVEGLDANVVAERQYGYPNAALGIRVVNPAPHEVVEELNADGEDEGLIQFQHGDRTVSSWPLSRMKSGMFSTAPTVSVPAGLGETSSAGDYRLVFGSEGVSGTHVSGGLLGRIREVDGTDVAEEASALWMRVSRRVLFLELPDVSMSLSDPFVEPRYMLSNVASFDMDSQGNPHTDVLVEPPGGIQWAFTPRFPVGTMNAEFSRPDGSDLDSRDPDTSNPATPRKGAVRVRSASGLTSDGTLPKAADYESGLDSTFFDPGGNYYLKSLDTSYYTLHQDRLYRLFRNDPTQENYDAIPRAPLRILDYDEPDERTVEGTDDDGHTLLTVDGGTYNTTEYTPGTGDFLIHPEHLSNTAEGSDDDLYWMDVEDLESNERKDYLWGRFGGNGTDDVIDDDGVAITTQTSFGLSQAYLEGYLADTNTALIGQGSDRDARLGDEHKAGGYFYTIANLDALKRGVDSNYRLEYAQSYMKDGREVFYAGSTTGSTDNKYGRVIKDRPASLYTVTERRRPGIDVALEIQSSGISLEQVSVPFGEKVSEALDGIRVSFFRSDRRSAPLDESGYVLGRDYYYDLYILDRTAGTTNYLYRVGGQDAGYLSIVDEGDNRGAWVSESTSAAAFPDGYRKIPAAQGGHWAGIDGSVADNTEDAPYRTVKYRSRNREAAPYYRLNVNGDYELEVRLFMVHGVEGDKDPRGTSGLLVDHWNQWSDSSAVSRQGGEAVSASKRFPLAVVPKVVEVRPVAAPYQTGQGLPPNDSYGQSYRYELSASYLDGRKTTGTQTFGTDDDGDPTVAYMEGESINTGEAIDEDDYEDAQALAAARNAAARRLFEELEIGSLGRVFSVDAPADPGVGTYRLSVSGYVSVDGNVDFVYADGALQIVDRQFVLDWPGGPVEIEYGEPLPASFLDAAATPFVPGGGSLSYTVAGEAVQAGQALDAGTYDVRAVFHSSTPEYASSVPVDRQLVVRPRPLTLTVKNVSKVFGDEDPVLETNEGDGGFVNGDAERIGLQFQLPEAYLERDGDNLEPAGKYEVRLQIVDPENRLGNYAPTIRKGELTVTKRPLTVSPAAVRRYPFDEQGLRDKYNSFDASRKNDMPAAWVVFEGLAPKHEVNGDARLVGTGKGQDNKYLTPSWNALGSLFEIDMYSDAREDQGAPGIQEGVVRILAVRAIGTAAGNYDPIDHSGRGDVDLTKRDVELEWLDLTGVILYGQRLRDSTPGGAGGRGESERKKRGNVDELLSHVGDASAENQDYTFDADIFDAWAEPGGGVFTYTKVEGGGPALDPVNGTRYLPSHGELKFRVAYTPTPSDQAKYNVTHKDITVRITPRPLVVSLADQEFEYGSVDLNLSSFGNPLVRYGRPPDAADKKQNYYRILEGESIGAILTQQMVLASNAGPGSKVGSNYYIAVAQSPKIEPASSNYQLIGKVRGSSTLKIEDGVYNLVSGEAASLDGEDPDQTKAARVRITRAPLTIRATDLAKVKGQPNLNAVRIPSPGYVGTSYLPVEGQPYTVEVGEGQLKNGDILDGLLWAPLQIGSVVEEGTDYGRYNITVSGGFSDNYLVTHENGTFTVQPPVRWNPLDLVYGEPLTGDQLNAESDDVDIAGSFEYPDNGLGTRLGAGSHPLRGVFVTDDAQEFEVVGSVRVARAELVVRALDVVRGYGEPNPSEFGYAIEGFATGVDGELDDISDLGGELVLSTSGGDGSVAGDYEIVPSGLSSDNYEIRYVSGTLTVTRDGAAIELSDLEQDYDGTARVPSIATEPEDLAYDVTYARVLTAPAGAPAEPLDESLYATEAEEAAPPVEAGWYIVRAASADSRYEGSAAALMRVSREASIVLSDLEQVYDGTPRAAAYTSDVDHLGVGLVASYDGMAEAPADAGAYQVSVSVDPLSLGYFGTAEGTLSVAKAEAAVSIDPAGLDQAVNRIDREAPLAVATEPGGLAVEIDFDGGTPEVDPVPPDSPASVGEWPVVARVADANYAGSAMATLTIRKAHQDIEVVNEGSYQPWPVAMAGDPLDIPLYADAGSGEPVTFSVDLGHEAATGLASVTVIEGNSLLRVSRPGDIFVRAVQAGDSYWAPREHVFLVSVAGVGQPVSIVLGDLEHVYDGTPKAAAVATEPEGLAVAVTYGGSAELPVEAGTYEVVASSADPVLPGQASGTLTIARAEARVIIDPATLAQAVNQLSAVAVSTEPEGLAVAVAYGGSPDLPADDAASIGEHAVRAEVADANYAGSAEAVLSVGRAVQTVRISDASLYDPWLAELEGRVMSIPLRGTSSSGLPLQYSIASYVPVEGDSAPLTAQIEGELLKVVHPGTYHIVATQPGDGYWGEASAGFPVRVNGVGQPVGIAISDLEHVYDGTPKGAAVSVEPGDLEIEITYNGSPDLPVDAGTYQVRVGSLNPVLPGSAEAVLAISKAQAAVSIDGPLSQAVGSLVPVAVSTVPEGLAVDVTYGGSPDLPADEASSVGEVAVSATVADSNYEGSAQAVLVVGRAAQTVRVTDPSLYDPWVAELEGRAISIPLRATSSTGLPVEFSIVSYAVDGQEEPILTGAVDGDVLVVAHPGVYTIRAFQAGDGYWAEASAEFPVVVGGVGQSATIELSDLEHVYDGSGKAAAVSVDPPDLEIQVTYDGSADLPVDAGSYRVSVASLNAVLPGSAEGTLTIAKAPAALEIHPATLSQAVNELAPLVVTTEPEGLAVAVTYDGSPDLPADDASSVGEVSVVASIDERNYMGSVEAVLVVGKAAQTVSVTDPSLYSPWLGELRGRGLEIPLRATASTGLPVSYTLESFVLDGEHVELPALIEGNLLKVVRPGTYVVKATQPGGDYWGEASTEFPVRVNGEAVMARLSFEAADLSQVYDGSGKTVGVSASPDTLEIEVTYDGSPDLPVDVGSYTVRARSADILIPGEISATLEIAKAEAEVSIDEAGLVQEANQLAPVAVTTVPEGLAVEVAYGGSPDLPPFDAASIGEVAVTATVVDANYTGAATAVLTIVKAGQAITVPNVDGYNPWPIRIAGQPLEIPLLGSSGSGLEVEFSVDAANASVGGGVLTATQPGSYTVRADQAGDGRWAAASTVEFLVVVEGSGIPTIAPRVVALGIDDGALSVGIEGAPNARVDILAAPDIVDAAYTLVRTIQLDVEGRGTIVLPTLGGAGFYKAVNSAAQGGGGGTPPVPGQ